MSGKKIKGVDDIIDTITAEQTIKDNVSDATEELLKLYMKYPILLVAQTQNQKQQVGAAFILGMITMGIIVGAGFVIKWLFF